MPKITNPIIIAKIRKGILEGKPDNQIIIDAGLSIQTANHRAKYCKTLKIVKNSIIKELKESDITIQLIINRLNEDRELARKKKDISTMKECDIWLGKYLAMFTDKIKQEGEVNPTYVINTMNTIKEEDKRLNVNSPTENGI